MNNDDSYTQDPNFYDVPTCLKGLTKVSFITPHINFLNLCDCTLITDYGV